MLAINPQLVIMRRMPRFIKSRQLCVDVRAGVPILRLMTLLIPRAIADYQQTPGERLFKSAALPDGVRWITVHPNGKDEPGVPIMIKESKESPGEYFVVGGAEGKMNHKKLTGVKSVEQYQEEQKAKQKDKRAAKKEEKKKLAEAGQLDLKKIADKAIESAANDNATAVIKSKIGEMGPIFGIDPGAIDAEWASRETELVKNGLEKGTMAYALAEANFYKKIESVLDAKVDGLNDKLLNDEVERARQGITGLALGRANTTLEIGAAYDTVAKAETRIAQLDQQTEAALLRGDKDTVANLAAQKEAESATIAEASSIIEEAGNPTLDELSGAKVASGKGYANDNKDRAVEAMVDSGALSPEKLREQIGDERQDTTVAELENLGASDVTAGLVLEDMQKRAALLEEAASLVEQGKHGQAYKKWVKAEKLITDWELRAERAVDKGAMTEAGPGGWLDNVSERVMEGRKGMAALSQASQAGLTVVPETVKQAEIDFDQLRKARAVQQKFANAKEQQKKGKKEAEDAAAAAGYRLDSDLIKDKFSFDAMSDDTALLKAEQKIAAARMAHWNALLLNEVENSPELTNQLDMSPAALQRAMAQHISTGAFNGLANATMISSGDVLVDRPVIDLFGEKGTAQLLAARLVDTLDPMNLDAMLDGLEQYHAETSTEEAKDAYSRASAAYEQARAIAFGAIEDPNDPIAMQYLNDTRRSLLESTLSDLGRTIGTLRAQAELVGALKDARSETKKKGGPSGLVSLGVGELPTEAIIQQMAALGIDRSEYDISVDAETKERGLHIHRNALGKMFKTSITQEDLDAAATAQAIKQGQRDESGWLPHGVARRGDTSWEAGGSEAIKHSIEPKFKGLDGPAMAEHARDYIASRVADGVPIKRILDDMESQTFGASHLDPYDAGEEAGEDMFGSPVAGRAKRDQQGDLSAELRKLFPAFKSPADPEQFIKAQEKYNRNREKTAQQLAAGYLAKQGVADTGLHSQSIELDAGAMEAAHRSLADNPAAILAYKAPQDLTLQDKGGLRHAFWNHYEKVSKEDREASIADKKAKQEAKDTARAESEARRTGKNAGMDAFFSEEETASGRDERLDKRFDEHEEIEIGKKGNGQPIMQNAREWQAEQLEKMNEPLPMYDDEKNDSDMGAGDSEGAARSAWDRYLDSHDGNVDKAYKSIQEHLAGEFNTRFAAHYTKLTGRPLQTADVTMQNAKAHALGLTSDPVEWKKRMSAAGKKTRSEAAGINRRKSGQFGDGEKAAAAKAKIAEAERSQLSLVQDEEASAGETAGRRVSLGDRVEGQLASIMSQAAPRWNPKADPVGLFSIGMGDDTEGGKKFYKQQRAIKMMDVQPKLGLFFGAGSGKSLTTIGMYTHLNQQGKVKRALFAVPSVVQKQFGGEALRYLDPAAERSDGRKGYQWHAEAGASPEERHAAYKNGNMDFMVLTHQGLRDDTYHAIAEHTGRDRDSIPDWFAGLSRKKRGDVTKAAFEHMGWHGFDMLYIDEAHLLSNRAGKEDSGMSNALTAIGDMTSHYIRGTGTPVKNDASEAFDHLSQLDPARFSDRTSFMRQYGGHTASARGALQRITARYFYQDKVESGVNADHQRPAIKLSDTQRSQYKAVHEAYTKARQENQDAKREKRDPNPEILIPAMQTLSPNSFKNRPEEEHLEVAKKLLPAAGAMRDSAYNRVINSGTFEDNAKFQEIARMADEYRSKEWTDAKGNKRTGKPGIVFARNLQAVSELKRGLAAAGHRVATITGSMSGDEKDAARRAFAPESKKDEDATADIMILSDAGNTGLNLQRGKWVAHVDTPLTSPTFEQRNARINRLGQTDDVDVHQLLTDTPFDGKAARRLETKSETSHVFQDSSHSLDDTGMAAQIQAAYRKRTGNSKARMRPQVAVDKPKPQSLDQAA